MIRQLRLLKKSIPGLFHLENRKAWFSVFSEFRGLYKSLKFAAPSMARSKTVCQQFRLFHLALFVFALTVSAGAPAWGADEEETPAVAPTTYHQRMMAATEAVEGRDDILMWGRLPGRLPQQVMGLRFDYRSRRYDSKFGGENRTGDVIAPIRPSDPFGGDNHFFRLVSEVAGRVQVLDLRLSYGVLDSLTFFVDFPLVKQEADLDFRFKPGTSAQIGVRTVEDLFRLYRYYGRPAPNARFDSRGWDPGDLWFGFSWTYHDTKYLTITSQPSFMLPTGYLADPNEAQRFGMGAQLDTGEGGFAPGFTQTLRLRFPGRYDFIGLRGEGSFFYFVSDERKGPAWNQPDATAVSTTRDLTLTDDRFLDLSGVDRNYTITPGARVETLAAVTFHLRYFTFGVGHLFDYHQEPKIDAAPKLDRFFAASDAYLSGDSHSLGLQLGVPLSWLRLPGVFNVGYAYPLGGRQSLRLEDSFDLQSAFFFPLF